MRQINKQIKKQINKQNKKMNFEEMELIILRQAVDKIEKKLGYKQINNPEIKEIISIVEDFLKKTKRICYGGTAINNILPLEDQFYDKSIELPDYDFYSPDPLNDAKKLADIYYKKGFDEVEAKAGAHEGTFKVFVNFMPVADITYCPKNLFKMIDREAIVIDRIKYCSADFLRMNMYLELSRPNGDTSRWEKVLKRLTLLNKNYPLKGKECEFEDVQRLFQYGTQNKIVKDEKQLSPSEVISKSKSQTTTLKGSKKERSLSKEDKYLDNIEEEIFKVIFNSIIDNGCVFLGAFANRMYLRKLRSFKNKQIPMIPDFDILSEDPERMSNILKERLTALNIKNIKIVKQKGIGEIISPHYELKVGPETIVFIYKPSACHSYNNVVFNKRKMRIATIDTMLSFYLAFLFADRVYYDKNRILCMSEFLFKVQQKNRLKQRGLLKRFSIDCYGEQLTREKMRAQKSEKYKELKNSKNSKEYQWWFLRYVPRENKKSRKSTKKTRKKSISKTPGKSKSKRKTRKNNFLSRLFS